MTVVATATTTDRASLRRRGYAARVLKSTFVRSRRAGGARSGSATLIVAAAFAPLIANTHPLLMRAGGRLHSPALAHLTTADVVLMCMFVAGAALLVARCAPRAWAVALAATLAGSALLGAAFTDPPVLTVHEQYREAARAGEIEWAIHAPVPWSPKDYQRDAGDTGLEAPLSAPDDRTHWFGTDENGADVLSRMIHASRIALGIGLVATGIAMLIGIVVGGLMGWFSGVVDLAGMRIVEIFEAVPTLFLLLTFVAFFGRSLYLMMVIIGLTELDRLRALRARRVPAASRAGLRAGGGRLRAAAALDPVPAHAAERSGADPGRRELRHRLRHPRRGDAELPRPRSRRRPLVGADAQPGGALLHLQLVDGGLPGRSDLPHRVRLQPDRRGAARCHRSLPLAGEAAASERRVASRTVAGGRCSR